jgi:hypothetical protein
LPGGRALMVLCFGRVVVSDAAVDGFIKTSSDAAKWVGPATRSVIYAGSQVISATQRRRITDETRGALPQNEPVHACILSSSALAVVGIKAIKSLNLVLRRNEVLNGFKPKDAPSAYAWLALDGTDSAIANARLVLLMKDLGYPSAMIDEVSIGAREG